jgi:hypothetical protein
MRQIVADQLDTQGNLLASRTFRAVFARCQVLGAGSTEGDVEIRTQGGFTQYLAVSDDVGDYQRIRIFEGTALVESLTCTAQLVVHIAGD